MYSCNSADNYIHYKSIIVTIIGIYNVALILVSNVTFILLSLFINSLAQKQGIHVSSTQLLKRDMIPMRIKMNKMTFEQRKRGLRTQCTIKTVPQSNRCRNKGVVHGLCTMLDLQTQEFGTVASPWLHQRKGQI